MFDQQLGEPDHQGHFPGALRIDAAAVPSNLVQPPPYRPRPLQAHPGLAVGQSLEHRYGIHQPPPLPPPLPVNNLPFDAYDEPEIEYDWPDDDDPPGDLDFPGDILPRFQERGPLPPVQPNFGGDIPEVNDDPPRDPAELRAEYLAEVLQLIPNVQPEYAEGLVKT